MVSYFKKDISPQGVKDIDDMSKLSQDNFI